MRQRKVSFFDDPKFLKLSSWNAFGFIRKLFQYHRLSEKTEYQNYLKKLFYISFIFFENAERRLKESGSGIDLSI